ncbi:MAG: creatininase family protein, partial [Erysipelotrichaceae bacterium]
MKLRTRFLPKLVNQEVSQYLQHHDLIFVPVGTVEMHGGFPLECESVISEAIALQLAHQSDALVLPHLVYFYAGATASGRGTVQVSIQEGQQYLHAIAHSLLRQGFRRQIYLSFHGPAHMTCSPMVRDFYDETGVPILYLDLIMVLEKHGKTLFTSPLSFHAMMVGAYALLGRIEEIPLASELAFDPSLIQAPTTNFANDLLTRAYQSGSIGYYFKEELDHMPTPSIESKEQRMELAQQGIRIIEKLVEAINIEDL